MTTHPRQVVAAALVALAVLVLLLLRLHDAPIHLPHQGVQSVLAAESLALRGRLEVAPNEPYAKFGPAYPVALAALSRSGLSVNATVYFVNCTAFAAALLGLFLLCRPITPLGAWIVPALYALWAPNYYLLRGARPDLLVACLAILAVLGTTRYLRRGALPWLRLATFSCTVAALSRYMAAVTLVPVLFLTVAHGSPVERPRRLRHALLFGLVTSLPLLAWLARNYRQTGYLTGMSRTMERHGESGVGLLGNLDDLLRTLYIDAFADDALGIRQVLYGTDPPGLTIAAGIGLLCSALLAIFVWRQRSVIRGALFASSMRGNNLGAAAPVLLVYAVTYIVALLVIWSVTNNDPINTRYLAPVYGHAMALAAMVLATALGQDRMLWPRWLLATLLLVLVFQSSGRIVRLLGDEPPGNRLINVTAGEANWVRSLAWGELDAIRLKRGRPGTRRSQTPSD